MSRQPPSCLPFLSPAGRLSRPGQPVPTLISSHFRVLTFFFSFSLIFQSVGFHLGTLIDFLIFFRFLSIACSAEVLVGPRFSSTTSFTRRCSRLLDTSNTPSPVLASREKPQLSFLSINTHYIDITVPISRHHPHLPSRTFLWKLSSSLWPV